MVNCLRQELKKSVVLPYRKVLQPPPPVRRAGILYSRQPGSASTRSSIIRIETCRWNTHSTTNFLWNVCVVESLTPSPRRFRRSRDAHNNLTQVRGNVNYYYNQKEHQGKWTVPGTVSVS